MRAPRLVSVALLACLALSACQKDPVGPVDPDDTATPSATATPTPTGPTPPTMPDTAKADTGAGAIAFVTHYVDLLNYAAASGSTERLRAASSGCEGCDSYAALYEKTYANGGYFHEGDWQPVAPFADVKARPAVVLTDIDAAQTSYKLKAGDQEKIGEAETYKLRFELTRRGSTWIVTRLTEQPTAP